MPNFVVAGGLEEMYRQEVNEERHEVEDVAPGFSVTIPKPDEEDQPQPAVQMEHPFEWKPFYWVYMAVGALVLYTLLKK